MKAAKIMSAPKETRKNIRTANSYDIKKWNEEIPEILIKSEL